MKFKVINIPEVKVPFKGIKLTKKQREILNNSVAEAKISIKEHFNNSGAWDLNASFYSEEIITKIFGIDFFYHFVSKISKDIEGVQTVWESGECKFKNIQEKVFLDGITSELYIAIEAKNINNDENLGPL